MSRFRRLEWIGALITAASLVVSSTVSLGQPRGQPALAPFRVVGDGIPEAIGGASGDADRGRALMLAREPANCIVCHAVPVAGVRFAGDLGPPLAGIARTLSPSQLRLRVVDSMRVRPSTIMPSYYRVEGFDQVAAAYRGRPILDAAQVEDIVAYLATLK